METWECWYMTALLQCAEKLQICVMYHLEVPQWPLVLTWLLLSTTASKSMSKAISIQGWPCGMDISFSYEFKHNQQPQLFHCCPLLHFLLSKCLKNIASFPSKGSNIFKPYAGKVFLPNKYIEAERNLMNKSQDVCSPINGIYENSVQFQKKECLLRWWTSVEY